MSAPSISSRLSHVLQATPISCSATTLNKLESLSTFLHGLPELQGDAALAHLLLSLAAATAKISVILRDMTVAKLSSQNLFDDQQLNVDLATNEAVLEHLRESGVCATASSEEEPSRIDLTDSLRPDVGKEEIFSVGFDPLDGSSIIDANFAVGSIFAVFPGRELLGKRVSEQRAAAISLYGPRTSIIFALPPSTVFEATLSADGSNWFISRRCISLAPSTKLFAPANLRCTTEDAAYKKLVQFYIDSKYTLRYSGGLVPDFYHALIKGNGVFTSPVTKSNKAKLRLVYECASLSMISLCAGGGATNERAENMSDKILEHYDQRSGLVIGSKDEVERYRKYHQEGTQS